MSRYRIKPSNEEGNDKVDKISSFVTERSGSFEDAVMFADDVIFGTYAKSIEKNYEEALRLDNERLERERIEKENVSMKMKVIFNTDDLSSLHIEKKKRFLEIKADLDEYYESALRGNYQ